MQQATVTTRPCCYNKEQLNCHKIAKSHRLSVPGLDQAAFVTQCGAHVPTWNRKWAGKARKLVCRDVLFLRLSIAAVLRDLLCSVTHLWSMCFQSTGLGFSWWLQIDDLSFPTWEDQVLYNHKRENEHLACSYRQNHGASTTDPIPQYYPFFFFMFSVCPVVLCFMVLTQLEDNAVLGCLFLTLWPLAAALSSLSVSQSQSDLVHMSPREVNRRVCLTFALCSRRASCANALNKARLECTINQRDASPPPYSQDS